MKLRHRFALISFLAIASVSSAQSPRIDPAGIEGALLICANGAVSSAAVDKFVELAGGAKAKIAVVNLDDANDKPAVMDQLAAQLKKAQAAEPRLLRWKDTKAVLPGLNGAWLVTSQEKVGGWERLLEAHPLRAEFLALLKRSGVVAVSGNNSEVVGKHGLGILPDRVSDNSPKFAKSVKDLFRGVVAFELKPGATLIVQGRTLKALGDSPVVLELAKSTALPARTIVLKEKAQEDLTALRRAALDRATSFPPALVEKPFVEKGTLVAVGGGGMPDGLFMKFVEYAGGKDKANIVILPTAQPDPIPKHENLAIAFKKAGAKKATVLYGRTLAEVESKEFLDTFKEATGIWFDGGRQWRFVDCYENTKALPLMFDVLKGGGVIGGTSAGATIQGDYLCRGGVFNNFDIRYEGYERGLGFLKGVAIDQHFSERKRQRDMTELMKVHPQYLGIGIDEATALVVKGSVGDVIGKGKVHFYDARRKLEIGDPDYEALAAGGRYDLRERKVVTASK